MNSSVIFIINLYKQFQDKYLLINFIKYQKMPPCINKLLEHNSSRYEVRTGDTMV